MPGISILLQLTVNGILFSAMYGIAAIGLSLIYSTMHIVFIAQGAVTILAAYACFWLFNLSSVNPYVFVLIIVPGFIVIGLGLYQLLFRKVAREWQFPAFLIAFGLMALPENAMSVIFTASARAIQSDYTFYAPNIRGINISFTRLMVFLVFQIKIQGEK